MAQEITQQSFFNHSSHAAVYNAAKIPLEFFLADTLLRSDLTRIEWASDQYAFRRRFELADAQGEADTLQPSSLNLPFINYWYTPGSYWEPDDRPFATNSQQMIRGQWAEGLPARMRAIAVKTSMVATAWYNREDDARLAYELLMWEMHPKGPVQLATSVTWKNNDIAIPVFTTIENVTFNPQFNETDWLKTQRMFPVQIKMTVRTYILSYPHQAPLVDLSDTRPQPPYNIGRFDYDGKNNDELYITEQVLLSFAAAKQWGDLDDDNDDITASLVADPAVYRVQNDSGDAIDGVDEALFTSVAINDTVLDIVTGYFSPSEEIVINECIIDPTTITTTSFSLHWSIPKDSLASLEKVVINVPGQAPIYITDHRIRTQNITGLHPNSQYDVTVLFYSSQDTIRDFHLSATTLDDPANPTTFRRRRGKLRGMMW